MWQPSWERREDFFRKMFNPTSSEKRALDKRLAKNKSARKRRAAKKLGLKIAEV